MPFKNGHPPKMPHEVVETFTLENIKWTLYRLILPNDEYSTSTAYNLTAARRLRKVSFNLMAQAGYPPIAERTLEKYHPKSRVRAFELITEHQKTLEK